MTTAVAPVALPTLPSNLGRGLIKNVQLTVGRWLYVLYDEVAEPWHERLILARDTTYKDAFWILTPDGDVYSEHLTDFKNVVLGHAKDRRVPIGLGAAAGQPVYRFKATPRVVEIQRATDVAVRAMQDRDAAAANPWLGAPTHRIRTKSALPIADHKVLPLADKKDDVDVSAWNIPDFSWVALAAVEGCCKAGDVLSGLTGGWQGEHFAIGKFSGHEVAVKSVPFKEVDQAVRDMKADWGADSNTPRKEDAKVPEAEPAEDVRTLPSKVDPDGERRRDFSESVALMWEEVFSYEEFPTRVPRISWWWLKDLKRDNTTPKRHHGTWASESNIGTRDRSYHEHEALCEIAEVFATIDQLNCASLFGYEKLIRRITAIEEAHGEPGSTPSWESAELLNEGRSKGGARIAPAMSTYLVKKQTEKNAVLKEKRKAEEHRRLKPKPKGGGKGGADDHV